MNAEVLQIISIVAFSLSGLFLVIAVILFFRLNIRSVVDDLSGKKAERQIRELRELNQQSNSSIRSLYQPSTGKSNTLSLETEKLPETDEETLRLQSEEDTDLLGEGTDLLETEGTSLLEETGTSLLEEGTTLLEDNSAVQVLQGGYHLLINEILIHTEERI